MAEKSNKKISMAADEAKTISDDEFRDEIKKESETKTYEELDFTDDFMFCKILSEHPGICKKLVELFTGRKVHEIRLLQSQLTIDLLKSGKGVRFDVWFEDEENVVYDFEMQTTKKPVPPKRTRYYQSSMDARRLKRGAQYKDLPDSYIVFICLQDPFNRNYCRYTFQNICEEDMSLPLGDGTFKIFLNADGIAGEADRELTPFLSYLKSREATDDLTSEIDRAVGDARDDEKGRVMYMTLQERDEEMREKGRAEMQPLIDQANAERDEANTERDQANAERDEANARADMLERELNRARAQGYTG